MTDAMELTPEHIRILAEIERDMDSGAQPFVRDKMGNRLAFPAHILSECGCISGQTASDTVIVALMNARIRELDARIAAH